MSLGGGRSMEAMRMRAGGAWRLARAGSYDSPHAARRETRSCLFVFRHRALDVVTRFVHARSCLRPRRLALG